MQLAYMTTGAYLEILRRGRFILESLLSSINVCSVLDECCTACCQKNDILSLIVDMSNMATALDVFPTLYFSSAYSAVFDYQVPFLIKCLPLNRRQLS